MATSQIRNRQLAAGIDAAKIADGSVSNTEFQYLDGVSSSIQTQIDSKLAKTLNSANIFVGNGSNVAAGVAMSGEASIDNAGAVTLDNDSVIAKVLTGFSSTTGTVSSSDSILSALEKLAGNVAALDSAVILKGSWDASSGSFPGSGSAQAGWSYIVSVAGTVDGVSFNQNDRIIAITDNASTTTFANNWFKADYTDQVVSVFGRTGAVSAQSGDYDASQVDSTAYSFITATNVQGALEDIADALNNLLPSQTGNSGKVLGTDGTNASWVSSSGGGGTPGGTSGQVQYNNSGSFGGFTVGGDATLNTSTGALTIANNAVSNAKSATMADQTFKGNVSGSSANPSDLTVVQVQTALNNNIITESTTARTLAIGDSFKYIRTTNSSATTITVPANASVAFAIGTQIDVFQAGTGQVTFAADGGVTINYQPRLKISTQYKGASLKKISTDEWDLIGSLSV